MLLLFKLAAKNLIGAGLRTWLNVIVLSFSFIIIIWHKGLLDGWDRQARNDMISWETGSGQYWQSAYDPYDPFSLTDAHARVPALFDTLLSKGEIAPVLITQGTIYPRGRIQSILIKGISPDQKTLRIPSSVLTDSNGDIPALIGRKMATDNDLKTGDLITLRWRDVHGTFDANEMKVAGIFDSNVPTIDLGQVWIPLNRLRTMMGMPDEATIIVCKGQLPESNITGDWKYKSSADLLKSVTDLIKMKAAGGVVFYFILMCLAMLAIFDTQVLSIFRRQKEIGTYIALGMTRPQVVGLFTIEGSLNSVLAAILAAVYGIPLLALQATRGLAFPGASKEYGLVLADKIFPVYSLGLIITTIVIIMATTTIVSYLPSRRIAKMKPTEALRGETSMIRFLLKGILRDKQRSLLPIVVVSLGVMLTVFLYCWLTGFLNDSIELNAKFSTGHVKIMTGPYAKNIDQVPNDLALTGTDTLILKLNKDFPEIKWAQRIHFGGLIDAPDSSGETRAQGPAIGFGIDMLSADRSEVERFSLAKSLRRGRLPLQKGDILMSEEFSRKLKVNPGDTVTFIGSTMNGSMAMYNFRVCGTVVFGTGPMDHGSVIVDLKDIRDALDMNNSAGEIVGFFPDNYYDEQKAEEVVARFNHLFPASGDEFAPVMMTLRQQNSLGKMIDQIKTVGSTIVIVFVLAMSLVFWNAGLLGGLRRYIEFGTRLAIGEDYSHIYKTMIYESILIGITGSLIGTAIGIGISFWLQENGLDIGSLMKNATVMMPAVFHTRVTPVAFFIGFIPGLFSTTIGSMLAGIGIYKRKTARLFKELEA